MKRTLLFMLAYLTVCSQASAADCQKALITIFGHEGSYQCLKNDSGNWTGGKVGAGRLVGTKYGIAAASYPKLDIKRLELSDASLIYITDYWRPLRLSEVKSQGLATTFLDTAVNCGTGTAAMVIEKTANMLNGSGPDYPLDTRISPEMVEWINEYTRPREHRLLFYLVFQALRSERYAAIAKSDKRKARFLPEWLLRTWED